jgi:hypothetical protein
MDEAALGVTRLRPGIGEQQEQAIEAAVRQQPQQRPRVVGPQPQIAWQLRCRLAALSDQVRQQRADAVVEHLAGDQSCLWMPDDLLQGVLAAAEAHLQPQLGRPRRKGRQWIGNLYGDEGKAWQRDLQQSLLARPQPVAAGPAVQPIRRRLQRPKADRNAGARSVLSHVNVPLSSSGSRPKWPYAEVGT